MAAIHELYTREMHTQFGHFACWLPNTRIALGDVGLLRGNRFEKVTSLVDLSVPHWTGNPSEPADIEYSSAGQVTVALGAQAALPDLAGGAPSARISLEFASEGATFFQAAQGVWESLTRLPELAADLARLSETQVWRPEYTVVTKVLRTGPAAIIVASQKGAKLELQMSAGSLAGPLPVANASGKLTIVANTGLAASVIASNGATPLFSAASLRRSLIGSRQLKFRSGGTAQLTLADVPWAGFADASGVVS